MDAKKWPVLAQVLIVLGCAAGIMGIVKGLSAPNIFSIFFGIVALVLYGNVYRLRSWALLGLTIFLGLQTAVIILVSVSGHMPIVIGVIGAALNGLYLYYFNSKAIKALFVRGADSTE